MNLRALTPLGWLVSAVAVIVAIALIAGIWNGLWSWLPWSAEARLHRTEVRADTAESDATARGLESQGNAEQGARTEAYGEMRIRVEGVTAESITRAQEAPDANDPLSGERAARLRDHDRRLCDIAPGTCEAAAPDAP